MAICFCFGEFEGIDLKHRYRIKATNWEKVATKKEISGC
jgi:hypothetical protein